MTRWKEAIAWALTQTNAEGEQITFETHHDLVDKVREYFNANEIAYDNFSYEDLEPYL